MLLNHASYWFIRILSVSSSRRFNTPSLLETNRKRLNNIKKYTVFTKSTPTLYILKTVQNYEKRIVPAKYMFIISRGLLFLNEIERVEEFLEMIEYIFHGFLYFWTVFEI